MTRRPLKLRQRVFVEEYLIDLNATQAAVRAGYSPRTARRTAQELLMHDGVQAAVDSAMTARSFRTGVQADRVLLELTRIAFADIGKAMDWQRGLPRGGLDPDTSAAVAGIWQTRDGVRVRMHDKVAALTLLGRHLGLFRNEPAQPASAAPVGRSAIIILPDNGRGAGPGVYRAHPREAFTDEELTVDYWVKQRELEREAEEGGAPEPQPEAEPEPEPKA